MERQTWRYRDVERQKKSQNELPVQSKDSSIFRLKIQVLYIRLKIKVFSD